MRSKKRKVFLFLIPTSVVIGLCFVYFRFYYFGQERLNPAYYPLELDSIKQLKKEVSLNYTPQRAEKVFVKCMTEKILPYWYGTNWDFNGTTQTPQKGSIACGYFVTTTLRDAGVPIERVKLARCASEDMIRALVSKQNIKHYPGINNLELERKLFQSGQGLYIIGLDNHTGFIFVTSNECFFIHASGRFPFKVIQEKVSESTVLAKSKYKVLGRISNDKVFLNRWLGKSQAS